MSLTRNVNVNDIDPRYVKVPSTGPFYADPLNVGLDKVRSLGDGYTINLEWFRAYPNDTKHRIAYNIYFSNRKETVFTEGIKFVSIDASLQANIINLDPGIEYFFSVRPVEYDPTLFDLSTLPRSHDNLRVYPYSLLRHNISATDLIIPLLDVCDFTPSGLIRIGGELIEYTSIDYAHNDLIVNPGGQVTKVAYIIKQGNSYYSANPNNVGSGYLVNLTLVDTAAPTDNWQIRCISVKDGNATFAAISDVFGAQSGVLYGAYDPTTTSPATDQFGEIPNDGYGLPILWTANGSTMSNGVLSFSISQTTPFAEGDTFLVQVSGSSIYNVTGGRGAYNYVPREHTVDGWDGYHQFSPEVAMFTIGESLLFDRVYVCQSRFEYPHFPHTLLGGYRQTAVDLLSTDLSAADAANVDFPMYDYAGYHRTDPVQLLNGTCVGSYIGGEMGCIDGYGNYNIYRGFSLQDQNTQRQDVLLSVDGRNAVLIRRQQRGIVCSCYLATSENPDDRCPFCYGTKYVFGYEQYFNPRSSDGRIKVRVSPTEEMARRTEAGIESEFPLDMWTLTVPTIKTRDVIVLFDQDDNEEFRYEVMGVTRNNTILGLEGGQHFKTMRIRKFDPAYQIRIFRNTSDFPSKLMTSIGYTPGIAPHTHEIVINEKVLSVNQINQTTAQSQGHNHPIVNGKVMEVLGHTHQIILP